MTNLLFEKFIKTKFSLWIFSNEKIIFRSKKEGLQPIVDYLKQSGLNNKNIIVFDKIIGNAVALLLVLLKPKKVCTLTISSSGLRIFKKYKINYSALKNVDIIKGKNTQEICPMEKLSAGKSPKDFYKILFAAKRSEEKK